MKQKTFGFIISVMLMGILVVACNDNQKPEANTEASRSNNTEAGNNDQLTQERLRRFDSLDFQFSSHQQWDSFAISHDLKIKVIYRTAQLPLVYIHSTSIC